MILLLNPVARIAASALAYKARSVIFIVTAIALYPKQVVVLTPISSLFFNIVGSIAACHWLNIHLEVPHQVRHEVRFHLNEQDQEYKIRNTSICYEPGSEIQGLEYRIRFTDRENNFKVRLAFPLLNPVACKKSIKGDLDQRYMNQCEDQKNLAQLWCHADLNQQLH